ncbi:two-component system, NarL family, sensor histidine kinase EvgS [Phycisphaerales bacterium]|nr:two-component system, NarL family, sensor histidine kinase EvgS [Phycisphaerales bacterium]
MTRSRGDQVRRPRRLRWAALWTGLAPSTALAAAPAPTPSANNLALLAALALVLAAALWVFIAARRSRSREAALRARQAELERQVEQHTAAGCAAALQLAKLELLHALSTDMVEGADVSELAARTVRDLHTLFPDLRARVWIRTAGDDARLVAASGESGPPDDLRSCAWAGAWGRALRAGETRSTADIQTETREGRGATWWDQHAVRAAIEAPLLVGGELAGSLMLDAPSRRAWSEQELRTAEQVAAYLAAALRLASFDHERTAAIQKLRLSEDYYRALFERNPEPMWVYDTHTLRFLAVNDAALECYGFTRDEFFRMTLFDIRPPEHRERLERWIAEVRANPAQRTLAREVLHRAKDGRSILVRLSSQEVPFIQQNARLAIAHEITDLKRAEEQALARYRELEALYNAAPVGMSQLDRDLRYVRINERLAAINGRPAADHLGRRFSEMVPASAREAIESRMRSVLESGEPLSDVRIDVPRESGSLHFSVTYYPVRDASGSVEGVGSLVIDVTQSVRNARLRAEFERALREIASHEPLERIFASICGAVEMAHPGHICSISLLDRDEGILRLACPGSLGPAARSAFESLRVDPNIGVCTIAAHQGRRVITEDTLADPHCAPFHDLARAEGLRSCWSQPILDGPGRVLGTLSIYGRAPGLPSDAESRLVESAAGLAGLAIEHHRAIRTLRENEERYELASSASQEGVWDRDLATDTVHMTPRCSELLGFTPDPSDMPFAECVARMHPDDRDRVAHASRTAIKSGGRYDAEFRMRARGGDYRWFRSRAVLLRRDGIPERLVGSLSDITDRKRAENALRSVVEATSGVTGEAFFRTLTANLAAALGVRWAVIATIDEKEPGDARTLSVNEHGREAAPMHYRLAGTPCQNVIDLEGPCFYPRDVASLFPADNALREMGAKAYAGTVMRDLRGKPLGLVSILHDQPITQPEDEVLPLLSVFAARAGAELERTRSEQTLRERDEQMRRSQRIEAIGRLASGVAHDFNNLLTAIRGYASLATSTLPEGHAALKSLAQVEEAARQATSVASSLLTFARKTPPRKATIPLASTIESAVRLFQRMVPSEIKVAADITPAQGLNVEGDDAQLQQVVMNLCLNARDAIGDQGLIEIKAAAWKADDGPPCARISVRDTGAGMSPEVRARVFEPFFTTKPAGSGTGLGLSVAHGIVQEHGGWIEVESAPGEGSKFTIVLPLASDHDPALQIGVLPETIHRPHGGRAMVLEPNQLVRAVLMSMLEALGYEVTAFESAEEAMSRAPEGDGFHIVVGERLPGADGWREFVRHIGVGDSPVSRIAVCGRDVSDEEVAAQGLAVLRKPFQLADLRSAIAQAAEMREIQS